MHRLFAAALAAVVGLVAAPALPVAAATTRVTRPISRPIYIPPPPDYRAPIAAALGYDLALEQATRDQAAGALAGNTTAHQLLAQGLAGVEARGMAERASVSDFNTQSALLDQRAADLAGAVAALDAQIHRTQDQSAALYGRPLAQAQADLAALGGDLPGTVDGAVAAIYAEARTELAQQQGRASGEVRALAWPEAGGFVISQPFGPTDLWGEPAYAGYDHFHMGIDLAAPEGTPVLAAADGVVVLSARPASAGRFMGYGNFVVVLSAGGLEALYGHLDSAAVSAGDVVHRGQLVGHEGSTGYSTGPHLHFEVHVQGTPVDPATLLPTR